MATASIASSTSTPAEAEETVQTTRVLFPGGGYVPAQDAHVRLRGYVATDEYATNLENTGFANWFASDNLCKWLGKRAPTVHFCTPDAGDDVTSDGAAGAARAAGAAGGTAAGVLLSAAASRRAPLRVLEIGSGLGRAGLMAAKIMNMCGCGDGATMVLTDGDEAVMELCRVNTKLNGFGEGGDGVTDGVHGATDGGDGANDAGSVGAGVTVECRQLSWGDRAAMDDLLQSYPGGFDLILGADLVYHSLAPWHAVLQTVQALLQRRVFEEDGGGEAAAAAMGEGGHQVPPPSFYLAFTKRSVAFESLTELAAEYGLEWEAVKGFTVDIFDNDSHLGSDMWRDCIVVFRAAPGGAKAKKTKKGGGQLQEEEEGEEGEGGAEGEGDAEEKETTVGAAGGAKQLSKPP